MKVSWTDKFPEPSDRQEASERLATIRTEIQDIERQLGTGQSNEAQWRRKALMALEIKHAQNRLLKEWIRTHPVTRQPCPHDELLIRAHSMLKRIDLKVYYGEFKQLTDLITDLNEAIDQG